AQAPFDVAGALWSALAMGAIIMAADTCARFAEPGQGTHAMLEAAAYALVALLAGAAFVRGQRRVPEPLLPLDIFA
ncbi:MFS transporter, partial [Salmonella enterica]